jgi:hypothetical protein
MSRFIMPSNFSRFPSFGRAAMCSFNVGNTFEALS